MVKVILKMMVCRIIYKRSSVHVDNKKSDILILGEGPTQALDDTTLTAEKKNSINFSEHGKKLCLSLHCNVANSYLFVNGVELHKFKAKGSEINGYTFYGYVYDFGVDYNAIAVDDILDIHKIFNEKVWYMSLVE